MSVVLNVYTVTGGELLKAFYNAVAGLFNAQNSHSFSQLFYIAIALGGFWTAGQFILKRDVRHLFGFLLKYALAMILIMRPTCDVMIHDRTIDLQNPALRVDNVPLVLGIVGSLSSSISDGVTYLLELIFHSPNDMSYRDSGMIMGAKLFLSASHIKITDPDFNANMQKFMQQCVFYDLLYNRYTIKELVNEPNIWNKVKINASVARGFMFNSKFKSCFDAAALLDGQWATVVEDAKAKYAGFAFGNRTDAQANFIKYLPVSYNYLTKMSGDASVIIQQNMIANAVRDGIFSMGARLNSKAAIESFSESRASEKAPAAWANIGLMAAYWLPILQCILFSVLIGFFVFIPFFLPFPIGLSFLKFYVTLYVWLALWPPIFTVLNYAMTSISGFYVSSGNQGTLSYQTGINQTYESITVLGGYLAILTIGLSFMFINRQVGGFISGAQQAMGVAQNAATSSAEEIQTGNYSYGNTHLANDNSFNNSAFHTDRNARVSMGGVETSLDGGSTAKIARDGSQTLSMSGAMSHTPLNIQLGESTREAFSQMSDRAMTAGFNKSSAAGEQYSASLRSLAELGDAVSHGAQSGAGHQISNSSGFNTAASKVSNLVDTFAKEHNISRDEATKVLGSKSVSIGGTFGFGTGKVPGLNAHGEIGANGRKEWDHSNSKQDARLYNDGRRFSEENHLTDVVNEARQATQDEHFRTFDDKSDRLAHNFSTGYDKSTHYRDEALASFAESEGYHQQANISNEQISAINLDAQTGFVDWLSHQRAPNSTGKIGLQQAEELIRHDPQLATGYAREFVKEKTSQSISQFNRAHPIGAESVLHKHNAYKSQIAGQKEVDNALSQYQGSFDGLMKNLNTGHVDPDIKNVVEKEFAQTTSSISERTKPLIEDGSKVMQSIIVEQSKAEPEKK
ncbi:MAG: conjugal transfer protein TraG N-terminal domain-containing protein [Gammaproteobacteria bacterium]|nr:conjugal transfer protein TraG N-terminal domain-containing protein [Gammaproteobacteria bacterium]